MSLLSKEASSDSSVFLSLFYYFGILIMEAIGLMVHMMMGESTARRTEVRSRSIVVGDAVETTVDHNGVHLCV